MKRLAVVVLVLAPLAFSACGGGDSSGEYDEDAVRAVLTSRPDNSAEDVESGVDAVREICVGSDVTFALAMDTTAEGGIELLEAGCPARTLAYRLSH